MHPRFACFTWSQVVRSADLEHLEPYERGDPAGIAAEIDACVGLARKQRD